MHASKVSLSKHSSNPQLLRVYIGSHHVISRWHLHHGLQLTADPVPLWAQKKNQSIKTTFLSSRALRVAFLVLTRALLAVSHVGSTARRVTVPAVTT